jgi:hypothetical protein
MEIGNVLVHVDSHPLAFVKHLHLIVAQLVSLLDQEKVKDTIRPFSKCSKACQEIAVPKVTLLNILWLRLAKENFSVWDFGTNFLPFDIFEFLNLAPLSGERTIIRREPFVYKFLTLLSELLQLTLLRTRLYLCDLLFDELNHIKALSILELELVLLLLLLYPLLSLKLVTPC